MKYNTHFSLVNFYISVFGINEALEHGETEIGQNKTMN